MCDNVDSNTVTETFNFGGKALGIKGQDFLWIGKLLMSMAEKIGRSRNFQNELCKECHALRLWVQEFLNMFKKKQGGEYE